MDIVAEQRIVIKYCVSFSKMLIETLSKLKEACGDECLAMNGVEMACNICERSECGTCVHKAN